MNIQISRLELINFKCFRHKELSFSPSVNTIRGRNGVGKTTIADAILFCLFGKNTAGQSDLELFKTRAEGRVIPNLDHSVEMVLAIVSDDSPSERSITLKRSIHEVWVKKRGSEETVFKNNTVEYFINGESATQADYKKYIDSLITEDIFRAITSPSYFLSLKWQAQRDFLTRMVGDITPEEIAGTDVKYVALSKQLSTNSEDITAYRKHLAYQIKKIKEQLDRIPVRLEEQNKALPERLDWTALEAQYTDVSRQSQEIADKIIAIRSGNADNLRKADLHKQLDATYDLMRSHKAKIEEQCLADNGKLSQEILELSRRFNTLLSTQRDLEASIPSFDTLKKRCQETLNQCEKDAQEIRTLWAENLNRKLQFTDSDCLCPTCGQYLPKEQVADKRQKAIEALNKNKAFVKANLTERAETVKQLRADAERQSASYDQQRAEAEKSLADVKEQINQVFASKQEKEKQKAALPTFEQVLANDEDYADMKRTIDAINLQLAETVTDDEAVKQQLATLETQKSEYTALSTQLQQQLATHTLYNHIQQLIEGINAEQRDLVEQLSELERKEDIACEYQDRQNAILEERVNQHFRLVQWHMFRTVNNGGDSFQEPYCECLVDGIPFGGGLNQANRLNAGLDIINTLCRHYSVTAPIVIDNAESNLSILPTASQQIRLEVADADLSIIEIS